MIHLKTCNGYRTLEVVTDDGNLPQRCRELEQAQDDGYAVVAFSEGHVVADAEGYAELDTGRPADPILAAYERRYDE